MLGKRHGYSTSHGLPYRPHSVTNVILGTVFLWVGWFGFNGGSALAINLRAVMACYVTNLAACCGAITWMVLDFRLERKWSYVLLPLLLYSPCLTPILGDNTKQETRRSHLTKRHLEQSASAVEQFRAS